MTLLVVLYATLWPDPVGAEQSMWFFCSDKLIHAIMMGGLVSAFLFDRRRSGKKLTKRYIITVAVSGIIFSCIDEYLQKTMNLGRSLEFADIVADTFGIIVASFTAPPVINRIFRNKKQA